MSMATSVFLAPQKPGPTQTTAQGHKGTAKTSPGLFGSTDSGALTWRAQTLQPRNHPRLMPESSASLRIHAPFDRADQEIWRLLLASDAWPAPASSGILRSPLRGRCARLPSPAGAAT